jgi:hypothetical protein
VTNKEKNRIVNTSSAHKDDQKAQNDNTIDELFDFQEIVGSAILSGISVNLFN